MITFKWKHCVFLNTNIQQNISSLFLAFLVSKVIELLSLAQLVTIPGIIAGNQSTAPFFLQFVCSRHWISQFLSVFGRTGPEVQFTTRVQLPLNRTNDIGLTHYSYPHGSTLQKQSTKL